jgi:protein phosphatase
VRVVRLRAGDRILLTTKGLTGVVPDTQLLGCANEHADARKCADALGQRALDSGSRDNVSCIVLDVAEKP